MAKIHPTAIVSPKAEIHDEAEIGPYAFVGDHCRIGRGTVLMPHAQVLRNVTIGEDNRISPNAIIGGDPQDLGFKGEETRVVIGDRNVIREFVTINRASTKENWETVIGNDNMLMAYVHIAHDDVIGNHVILANSTMFAGHVHIHDNVVTSGFVTAHQFVHVGECCFLAPGAMLNADALPGCIYFGHPAEARVLNEVGLRRHGIDGDQLRHLKTAFKRVVKGDKPALEALAELESEPWFNEPFIQTFAAGVRAKAASFKGRSEAHG